MTVAEMHIAVKLGLDKSAALELPAFEPEEIDNWLNVAQDRFIKQRLFGTNVKRQGFEGDVKRLEDLRSLIRTESVVNTGMLVCESESQLTVSTKYPNTYYCKVGDVGDYSVSMVANDLTFASVGKTITDASAEWLSSGFMPGMQITVVDSDLNDRNYNLFDVTNAVLYTVICTVNDEAPPPAAGTVMIVGDTKKSAIPLFNYFVSARLTMNRTYPIATNELIDCKLINHEDLPKFLETYSNSPRFINPVCFFEGERLYVTTDSLTTAGDVDQIFYVTYVAIPARITITPDTYANADFPITDLRIGSWYIAGFEAPGTNGTVTHDRGWYSAANPSQTFKATCMGASDFAQDPTLSEIGECELPKHTHQEIVDIAVNLMIENIESPRFATNIEQLKVQE